MTLPDGWLNADEERLLSRIAAGKSVLELGAWKGRSTVVFARVASIVVSCDSHRGIAEAADVAPTLPAFMDNVRDLDNVIAVVGDWTQAEFVLRQFDVVYVDGKHDADSACRDLLIACRLGRTVAAHDWDMRSVRYGARRAGMGEPDEVSGSVAVWRKLRGKRQ